ncbi:MmgE/PrpD family protein [Nocardioides sp. C4-1]|uniref:MmgE/PrpD family protein n=1 Tax=Nocardioides sp. C4-1 TaxID=3151851 RepID=UPI0032644FBB
MSFGWRELSPEHQEQLRLLVVDALGLAAAGSANADAQRVLTGLSALAPGPVAVPWTTHRLAAPQAATALSTLIHAWDFDDTHDDAVVHTSTVVVPTALAAAAVGPVGSGAAVLDGIATGVQVLSRLAGATGPRPGVIRTAGLGAPAAAATAATVWGLPNVESGAALAVGGAMAPTTRQAVVDGSVAKRLQPGLVAAHGLTAAALARAGVAGPSGWLGGEFGILPGSDLTFAEMRDGDVELDRIALKPYPACRYGHAAIAAAEMLHADHPDWARVERVVAHLPAGDGYALVARPYEDRGAPLVDAQFSLPWQVAALWVTGRYSLATLVDDLGRPDIAAAAARVEVRQDLPPSTVMSGAVVDLHLSDGRTVTRDAAMPGGGEHRLDRDTHARKLAGCLEVAGVDEPAATADRLWRLVDDLPDLSGPELTAALAHLGRPVAVPA